VERGGTIEMNIVSFLEILSYLMQIVSSAICVIKDCRKGNKWWK